MKPLFTSRSAKHWLVLPLIVGLQFAGCADAQIEALPALNIDITQTSVSGISSGGFMAGQFQVAHSSIIKGAGIVAAGPYNCSQDDVMKATTLCSCTLEPTSVTCKVTPTSADVPTLVSKTQAAANAGLIDPVAGLIKQKVFTFAGGQDHTVPKDVVAQTNAYYQAMGIPVANIQPMVLDNAGHTMPTPAYGNDCPITGSPYIGKCKESGAGDILKWIYGALAGPTTPKGKFIQFDQRPFIQGVTFYWDSSMDASGWLYVPAACQAGQPCKLHIALHGCKQGQSYLPLTPPPGGGLYYGTTFVKNAGYNEWADANNLVILYPQATTRYNNPNGCWDWWGYTNEHYADKLGVQIKAVRAMVDRLSSGKR